MFTKRQSLRQMSFYLLLLPFVLWIGLLLIIPQMSIVWLSFQERIGNGQTEFSLLQYQNLFGSTVYNYTLWRTVWMSVLATGLTLVICWPVALYISKVAQGRSKTALYLSCLLPFWIGELVRVLGWMIILRETGLISWVLLHLHIIDQPIEFLYRDITLMSGLIYTSMLFMIVPLVSVLESLDDAQIEAGYDLGGNGWIVLWKIIIPHAKPGIVSGCIIVFMLNLGNYLTPSMLGGKSAQWFTELIYSQFITRFNWEFGAAFGVVLLLTSTLIVWMGLRLTGQSLSRTMGGV
ncbi:MAG: ABC transporter permease [Candidatus Pacebacteria bacterium]|nr:ABC transporter permease [Candidatus Paceibacterota bacterium]